MGIACCNARSLNSWSVSPCASLWRCGCLPDMWRARQSTRTLLRVTARDAASCRTAAGLALGPRATQRDTVQMMSPEFPSQGGAQGQMTSWPVSHGPLQPNFSLSSRSDIDGQLLEAVEDPPDVPPQHDEIDQAGCGSCVARCVGLKHTQGHLPRDKGHLGKGSYNFWCCGVEASCNGEECEACWRSGDHSPRKRRSKKEHQLLQQLHSACPSNAAPVLAAPLVVSAREQSRPNRGHATKDCIVPQSNGCGGNEDMTLRSTSSASFSDAQVTGRGFTHCQQSCTRIKL